MGRISLLILSLIILISTPGATFAKKKSSKYTTHPVQCIDTRDFHRALSTQEEKDLIYVLETSASKPLAALIFYRSNLEKAGQRLNAVHPLRLLAEICGRPQLRRHLAVIGGRSLVWKEWLSETADSLARAYAGSNLNEEMLGLFAAEIAVAEHILMEHMRAKDWSALILSVNKHAP
jgi:hypothetical protein